MERYLFFDIFNIFYLFIQYIVEKFFFLIFVLLYVEYDKIIILLFFEGFQLVNKIDLILYNFVFFFNIFCLQGVDQILFDLSLWEYINMNNIRQRFSEFKRINVYGLEFYEYFDFFESERLYFISFKYKKKRLSFIRIFQNLKFK